MDPYQGTENKICSRLFNADLVVAIGASPIHHPAEFQLIKVDQRWMKSPHHKKEHIKIINYTKVSARVVSRTNGKSLEIVYIRDFSMERGTARPLLRLSFFWLSKARQSISDKPAILMKLGTLKFWCALSCDEASFILFYYFWKTFWNSDRKWLMRTLQSFSTPRQTQIAGASPWTLSLWTRLCLDKVDLRRSMQHFSGQAIALANVP